METPYGFYKENGCRRSNDEHPKCSTEEKKSHLTSTSDSHSHRNHPHRSGSHRRVRVRPVRDVHEHGDSHGSSSCMYFQCHPIPVHLQSDKQRNSEWSSNSMLHQRRWCSNIRNLHLREDRHNSPDPSRSWINPNGSQLQSNGNGDVGSCIRVCCLRVPYSDEQRLSAVLWNCLVGTHPSQMAITSGARPERTARSPFCNS